MVLVYVGSVKENEQIIIDNRAERQYCVGQGRCPCLTMRFFFGLWFGNRIDRPRRKKLNRLPAGASRTFMESRSSSRSRKVVAARTVSDGKSPRVRYMAKARDELIAGSLFFKT